MTETLHNNPGVDSHTDSESVLTLVNGDRFPNFTFELSEKTYITTGVIDATDTSRYRHSVRLIDDVMPEGTPETTGNQHKRTQAYLSERVDGPHGSRIKRHDAIDRAVVVGSMLEELAQANHPVSQLLEQFRDSFADELGEHTVTKHASDLLVHYFPKTYYKRARAAYEAQKPTTRR